MTGSSTAELVDTRDMLVVHTALLRELRLAPGLVERAPAGGRRRRIGEHLDFVLGMLTHHHHGEDRLLWPKLTARIPQQLAGLIATMEDQHTQVEQRIGAVRDALAEWRGDDATAGDTLSAALRRLHEVVAEHLDAEEQQVLPLAALHLTAAEWREIGESGVESIPLSRRPLVFGMLMYEGDPAVLKSMLAVAPAVPRRLVPLIGPRIYARHCRRVHGTATP